MPNKINFSKRLWPFIYNTTFEYCNEDNYTWQLLKVAYQSPVVPPPYVRKAVVTLLPAYCLCNSLSKQATLNPID